MRTTRLLFAARFMLLTFVLIGGDMAGAAMGPARSGPHSLRRPMPSPPPAVCARQESAPAVVKVDGGRLRLGPSRRDTVTGLVPHGTRLTLLHREGEWFHVLTEGGRKGWMHQTLLRPDVPSTKPGVHGAGPKSSKSAGPAFRLTEDKSGGLREGGHDGPASPVHSRLGAEAEAGRVRQGPCLAEQVQGHLPQRADAAVLDTAGPGVLVAMADGLEGWSPRSLFVSDKRQDPVPAPDPKTDPTQYVQNSMEQHGQAPAQFQPVLPSADYVLLPRIDVRESYDDNVFFNDEGDLEQRLSPSLEFGARTERLDARVLAKLDFYNYLDLTQYDRVNQYYRLYGAYDLSPRDTAGLESSFRLDHTFESELEESGLVQDRSRRERYLIRPFYERHLDERTKLALEYRFNDTRYDNDIDTDYVVHGASASYSRLLRNQKTTVLGSLDTQYVEYDPVSGDGDQLTIQALAGVAHSYAPNKDVVVRGGLSYTDSSYEVGGRGLDDDNWGYIFDITGNWHWELTDLSLSASRTITASSFGENITRDRLLLSVERRLTERLRAYGNLNLYRSETEGVVDDEERRTLIFTPGLRYRLTELVDLRLGYSYTATEDVDADEFDSRNVVFGQIDFRFSDLLD